MQLIKTPGDLGQILRARRKQLGWNQAELAEQIGVSRQWLIDIEKGKPRAELGLALRAIYALGLSMHLDQGKDETTQRTSFPAIDLDGIVERSRRTAGPGRLEVVRADDVSKFLPGRKSADTLGAQFSAGIPEDISKHTQRQRRVAETNMHYATGEAKPKQLSTGIPADLHQLMREQNTTVAPDRRQSEKTHDTRQDDPSDTPPKKSKRSPMRPSSAGKPR